MKFRSHLTNIGVLRLSGMRLYYLSLALTILPYDGETDSQYVDEVHGQQSSDTCQLDH